MYGTGWAQDGGNLYSPSPAHSHVNVHDKEGRAAAAAPGFAANDLYPQSLALKEESTNVIGRIYNLWS